MASIFRRPVDLFFVSIFASFAVIAVTIDFVQSTYGAVLEKEALEYGSWPPAAVVDAYVWWCRNYDSLLGHNPVWFETLAWVSPFVYTPFYFFAIYAFIYKKEWIRIPGSAPLEPRVQYVGWVYKARATVFSCQKAISPFSNVLYTPSSNVVLGHVPDSAGLH
ncbi:hypothetical protein GBAR_LOCUS9504 [Geodia barretti]|uniref:EXPERA domain-containing protein n=1 Tax=Geodia barretti TaxID=519541 RepID=A0AA35RQE0_GEOBA|nr:hypothetical protein GBAR_LOCUS9504 [Geodia barretti]